LASLDPFGSTMLLSTLYWPDEIRDAGDLDIPDEDLEFKPAEIEMAKQLVNALTGDFDASRYKDEYREALLKVIDSKVAGQPVEAPLPEAETSKLTDLMAVLEASVAAARAEPTTDTKAAATEPISVDKARKRRATKSKSAKAKAATAKSGASTAKGKSRAKSATTPRRKSA
jgi:DNA end-binding protein Ku